MKPEKQTAEGCTTAAPGKEKQEKAMWGCGYLPFMGFGGGVLGMIASLMFIALLAYLAVKMFRSLTSADSRTADRRDSLEILKTRLAKGEIGVDDYNTLKKVL